MASSSCACLQKASLPLFVFAGRVSIILKRQLLCLPQNSFPKPHHHLPPTHSHSFGTNPQPSNPIKSRSSGWMLSRCSSNSVYGKSRGPVVSISICIRELHTIKAEILEEFHQALFSVASGHSKGRLHLFQNSNKNCPLPICPSVYTCLYGDYTAVLTQHLLGEDQTNLVQPPSNFNKHATKNPFLCVFQCIHFCKMDCQVNLSCTYFI